jgi:hypothetical protein
MRSSDRWRSLAPAGRARGGSGAAAAGDVDDDPSSDADRLSAAVEAELALLEGDGRSGNQAAPPEDGPDVDPGPGVASRLAHLAPGEEAAPEPVAPDTRHDGPLVLPFDGAAPGSYHVELSRFLTLFVQRHGIEGRIANLEAVLRLDGTPVGAAIGRSEEVRLPLDEPAQLAACLRRRADVVGPTRLLALCLGRGRYAAVRAQPRLTASDAVALLSRERPVGPDGSDGSDGSGARACRDVALVHRAFVQLNFQLTLRYYRREERLISLAYSVDDETAADAIGPLLEPELWTGRGVGPARGATGCRAAIERLERAARACVARRAAERHAEIQKEIDGEVRANVKILDDYYQEKTRELEDEKRAVYFHLYYFEKEEAIDRQLSRMRSEQEEQSRAMETFWDVKVDTRFLSVGYFEIPFYEVCDPAAGGLAVDALVARVVAHSGACWPVGDGAGGGAPR